MITTYLLKNCPHCKKLLKFIQENPNLNMCLIIVSKADIDSIKKKEPRIKQFPVSFFGNPKTNGLPYKNAPMITGSSEILNMLQTNFGSYKSKLKGSNIDIDYLNDNEGNISSLTNIRKHRNNCFGKTCHVMDRPFGPSDNQYILQGFQPSSAIPLRSDLPVKPCRNKNSNTSFGMTTPGTPRWQSERKIWKDPSILVSSDNYLQNMLGNKDVKMNVPMTYKNDYINTNYYDPLKIVHMTNSEIAKYNPSSKISSKTSSNFGKKSAKDKKSNKYGKDFIRAPVNQTYPFLTYAAGSNGVSRITGKNYLPEQVPIQSSPRSSYLSKNIKDYVSKNSNSQRMLYEGLNSPWSINAQGINENKYGDTKFKLRKSNRLTPSKPRIPRDTNIPTVPIKQNKPFGNYNPWTMTRTPSGANTIPAQYFKRDRFIENGNGFGKNKKSTTTTTKSKKKMKFTSPLGIEISFE